MYAATGSVTWCHTGAPQSTGVQPVWCVFCWALLAAKAKHDLREGAEGHASAKHLCTMLPETCWVAQPWAGVMVSVDVGRISRRRKQPGAYIRAQVCAGEAPRGCSTYVPCNRNHQHMRPPKSHLSRAVQACLLVESTPSCTDAQRACIALVGHGYGRACRFPCKVARFHVAGSRPGLDQCRPGSYVSLSESIFTCSCDTHQKTFVRSLFELIR